MKLKWEISFDDRENTYWKASSNHELSDGTLLEWHIRQVLASDSLRWFLGDSSAALIDGDMTLAFCDIEDAKDACQEQEDRLTA